LRVTGPGLRWMGYGTRPIHEPSHIFHSERWTETKEGVLINLVAKRKSKRRFPDLPPIT